MEYDNAYRWRVQDILGNLDKDNLKMLCPAACPPARLKGLEKEKLVIALYHYEELTLKEIGVVLDISESRVSQIHSKVILKLRSKLLQKINA